MQTTLNYFLWKQKILESTTFLYFRSLLIFFGPPLLTIIFIHKLTSYFMNTLVWISFVMVLVFPISALLSFLMDHYILKHEPIIYNLKAKNENIMEISKLVLIKILLFLFGYTSLIMALGINNLDSTILNIPFIFFTFILGYLNIDLFFYLLHLLQHRSRFLYRHFHVYHHQSTVTSIFTYYRMSVFENTIPNFISTLIFAALVNCFGLFAKDTYSYLIGYILVAIQIEYAALIGHSNREYVSYKVEHKFPFNILATNVMHAMHHARIHCNYGAFTKVWDTVFRTISKDHSLILKRVSQGNPLIKLSESIDQS